MPIKKTNFAKATDAQLLIIYLAMRALDGSNGIVENAPADLTPFQLDVIRLMVNAELYSRSLTYIVAINAMP